jgi:hypothetical protein
VSDRAKNGVPLPDDTWTAIVDTAREVRVSEVIIQRATGDGVIYTVIASAAKQSIAASKDWIASLRSQ